MKPTSGSPNRFPAKQACGFTLLEVLIAMAVLAIALAAAIKAVSDGARTATHIEERTLAHWLALNKIAEQRLGSTVPPVGIQQGSAQFAGQDWHWTAVVSETPDASTRRLQIEIRHEPGAVQPLLSRTAFLPVLK
jgi:general secretion pathway protein I